VGSVVGLQAKPSWFLGAFDDLIAVTALPHAYISRSGYFRADNNRWTNRFTLPLAHARRVINGN
jgi:hypothetical protein